MNSRPQDELERTKVTKTGRREGERETFTKAPGTGLVKETIPAGAEKVDVRAPIERAEERTTPKYLYCSTKGKGTPPR